MKYLKVKMSEKKESRFTSIEELAASIKCCYPITVSSVEICDDEPQEVKRTEIGTLDIGEGMVIGNKEDQCDFAHGDVVNLNNHPEFRRHCKKEDIKTMLAWDLGNVKEGSIVVVEYPDHSECGYLRFNADRTPAITQDSIFHRNRRYIGCDAISIRVLEGVK